MVSVQAHADATAAQLKANRSALGQAQVRRDVRRYQMPLVAAYLEALPCSNISTSHDVNNQQVPACRQAR